MVFKIVMLWARDQSRDSQLFANLIGQPQTGGC